MGVGASIGVVIGILAFWLLGMFVIGKAGTLFRRTKKTSADKAAITQSK